MKPTPRALGRDESRFDVQSGTMFLASQRADALAAAWTRVSDLYDISSSGIAFRSDAYYEPASTLWVTLTGTERLEFKVVYCLLDLQNKRGFRCGIKVMDPAPSLLTLIKPTWHIAPLK